RSDDRLEREYLQALAADTRSHMADYGSGAERMEEHIARTATNWGWANDAAPQEPVGDVLLWLRLGGQLNLSTQFQNGAYHDLVNSGKLSVIRNRAVRAVLIDYQNYHVRWTAFSEANGRSATNRYTDAVA